MVETHKTVADAGPEASVPSLDMGLGSREQHFKCRTVTRLRVVETKAKMVFSGR